MADDVKLSSTYRLEDPLAEGTLRVWLQHEESGEVRDLRTTKNIITYGAADVMAKSVIGDNTFKLSHILFQHGATGTFTPGLLPPFGVTRDDVVDDLDAATGGPVGITAFETPLISFGFSRSPEVPGRYQHNIVTVTAVAGSDSLDNESFVGAGLVARVGATDVLFAHQVFLGLEKLPQFQVVGAWSVRYL